MYGKIQNREEESDAARKREIERMRKIQKEKDIERERYRKRKVQKEKEIVREIGYRYKYLNI